MATLWRNADGLVVRFDDLAVTPRDPRGEAPGAGETRTVDVNVDLTKTVATVPYNEWGAKLPANSFIQHVQYTVLETITGASALTFGTQYYDGTEYDYDGLITGVSALTIGTDADIAKGGTNAGAQVGTLLASPANLVLTTTGQATAGRISLRVHLLVPKKAPDVVWHGA